MQTQNKILYIKADRAVEVTGRDVTIGDVVTMACTDKSLLSRIRTKKVLRLQKKGRQRCVVSVMEIISLIQEICPSLDIRNLGETDVIVTCEDRKTPSAAWHIIKTAFVAAITFCGAAFSIMAFNNDVDVTKLFGQIYLLATGRETDGFTVLEIMYSIGISLGILIFFNHFGKKRFTADPTPMEVQMRLYENDLQTTLIQNSSRKGDEIDVDGNR